MALKKNQEKKKEKTENNTESGGGKKELELKTKPLVANPLFEKSKNLPIRPGTKCSDN